MYSVSYEELEEWKPYIDPQTQLYDINVPVYRGRPSYALSTFECLLRLSITIETILDAFYSTRNAKMLDIILYKAGKKSKHN